MGSLGRLFILIVCTNIIVAAYFEGKENAGLRRENLPWLTKPSHKLRPARLIDHHTGHHNQFGEDFTRCPVGTTGQFPYPPDCMRFLNCWKGRGQVQVCPPGTLFNPETLECDFPNKVKCIELEQGDQVRDVSDPGYVRFPNARPSIGNNPHQVKTAGRADLKGSPSQQQPVYANQDASSRSYYRNEESVQNYGHKNQKPSAPQLSKQRQEEQVLCPQGATGLLPHPTTCSKFLNCWGGRTFIQDCGPGTVFNPAIGVCDWPSSVRCEDVRPIPYDDPTAPAEVVVAQPDNNDFLRPSEKPDTNQFRNPRPPYSSQYNHGLGQENKDRNDYGQSYGPNRGKDELQTSPSHNHQSKLPDPNRWEYAQGRNDNDGKLDTYNSKKGNPNSPNGFNQENVGNNGHSIKPFPQTRPTGTPNQPNNPEEPNQGFPSYPRTNPETGNHRHPHHLQPYQPHQPHVHNHPHNYAASNPYKTNTDQLYPNRNEFTQFDSKKNSEPDKGSYPPQSNYNHQYRPLDPNPQPRPNTLNPQFGSNYGPAFNQYSPQKHHHHHHPYPNSFIHHPHHGHSTVPNSGHTHVNIYNPNLQPPISNPNRGQEYPSVPDQPNQEYPQSGSAHLNPELGQGQNNPNQQVPQYKPDQPLSHPGRKQPGKYSPHQPTQTGYNNPNQPNQPGYNSLNQPTQSGYNNPYQPTKPGYNNPNQPTKPGYNNPNQPTQPGYNNPNQPTQPGYNNPNQPTQPGYNSPYQPYNQPGHSGTDYKKTHQPNQPNINNGQQPNHPYQPSQPNQPIQPGSSNTPHEPYSNETFDDNLDLDEGMENHVLINIHDCYRGGGIRSPLCSPGADLPIEDLTKDKEIPSPTPVYPYYATTPNSDHQVHLSDDSLEGWETFSVSTPKPLHKSPFPSFPGKSQTESKNTKPDHSLQKATGQKDQKYSPTPGYGYSPRFNLDPHDSDQTLKEEIPYGPQNPSLPQKKKKETPPSGQDIRLRGGNSFWDGYLEVKSPDGHWGLACDAQSSWNVDEANVICRQLGFFRGAHLSWQGFPMRSDLGEMSVSVTNINCTGKEFLLKECQISYDHECEITRDAIGLRCYRDLASECQPGELNYNGFCYSLVTPKDIESARHDRRTCTQKNGNLVDINYQQESDILSEWLIKEHLNVTTALTGGVGASLQGRPIWGWSGSTNIMNFHKWWQGWDGARPIPMGKMNRPLAVILKKNFQCKDESSEVGLYSQATVDEDDVSDEDGGECEIDYFFWDAVELVDLQSTNIPHICKRPVDDVGCYVNQGESYDGSANVTISGTPCLAWNHPKAADGLHKISPTQLHLLKESHNYCRMIRPTDRHPWCYVDGAGNSEYCDIPHCLQKVPGYPSASRRRSTCSPEHFECKPMECVAKSWFCDGSPDCSNGNDEKYCEVYMKEFHKIAGVEAPLHVKEEITNIPEYTCAKKCVESKKFHCKSFNYSTKKKKCVLSTIIPGLARNTANNEEWNFYERVSDISTCTVEKNNFQCTNGHCVHLDKVCDGKNDCGDMSDESRCSEELGYEVRLVNGKAKNEGRIEIKVFGVWGTICDDKFDLRDANVICRELGYKLGAVEILSHSHFPATNSTILVDDLDCLGNETSIQECNFGGWGVHNCHQQENAGVVCKVPGMQCPEGQWQCKSTKECILTSYLCDNINDCDDGSDEESRICKSPIQMRLVGGPNVTAGRLEVRHYDIWGTVCDDDFSPAAADVVCRSLGYHGISQVKKEAFFGAGKGQIWLDQVHCLGNETTIADCFHSGWGQNNCKHDEDVSILCSRARKEPKYSRVRPVADEAIRFPVSAVDKLKHALTSNCTSTELKPIVLLKQERLVGGDEAKLEHIPWQASIRIRAAGKSVHWCGAIVVSPYHILTAGHCLRDYSKSVYFIRVGDFDTEVPEPSEQELNIDNLYIHEDFNTKYHLNNDIAIVKVKGEIVFSEKVKPICLEKDVTTYEPDTNCTVSGWGSLSANSAGFARTLRSATLPLLEPSVCRASFVYGDILSEGMFCAGHLQGGVDSCQGDSGGPLVCKRKGKNTLFGITSWGQGCGRVNKPGVYTNVAFYHPWIQGKMNQSMIIT